MCRDHTFERHPTERLDPPPNNLLALSCLGHWHMSMPYWPHMFSAYWTLAQARLQNAVCRALPVQAFANEDEAPSELVEQRLPQNKSREAVTEIMQVLSS